MKTLTTGSRLLKSVVLACAAALGLSAWAANAPNVTVNGTAVTISNESGAESWDNATLSPLSSYQNRTFTVPEIGTDVPAGTILKVSSVSFAKSTSMNGYPAKIKIAGCVSAAATVTSGGFTTANADKITYSFDDGICLLKAGTASQIAYLDANGVQLTSGGSFAFRVGYNAYQFVGGVVWSSKVPIIEIEAEIVEGYVAFEASSGNGWGFQSGSGSGKVYVSGYKNYMLTPGNNEKEIVLTDGTYGYAFDIKDANSMSSQNPNQITDWAKISGDGTLTTASANSSRLPFLLLRDTSDFTGTINATASCKLTTVFCGTSETFGDGVLYNKLFANYTGSMYVTSERSTSNSNVVTVPAGKTWTGTALLNEGETVIDGTFAGPVVNSGNGTVTINGTVNGNLENSGGLVTINGTVTGVVKNWQHSLVANSTAGTLNFGTDIRNFNNCTIDSAVEAKIVLTAEEYGKGAVSVTNATGVSSITVYAPDGTTLLGTITPDTTGAGELALASVNVSGLACWYDWEMNGNLDGSGVNTGALTYDSGSAANNFYNSSMLYTYRHPYTSVTFPETWTAVVRCTVPKVVNGTVITFGTRYTSFIGLIAGDDPETEMKLVRYNTGDQAYSVLASIPIVDGTSAQHVYIFSVENNSAVKVYCDGSIVLDETFDAFSLGGGIQIGSAHGGVAGGLVRMWAGDTYDGLTTSDLEEARVDCVRLYDYSLSAEQVAALSAEFPAVKLYRATAAADADTTWGELSWAPSWDGGNSQSKVILTAEGDATVTLPATITAEEVQLVIPAESTVALTGPGTLAVTEPVDVSGGTLSLSGTLTLDEDLVISGSVVFDGVTTDGTGGLKLANSATVGVANGSVVVTPLGTYTLAEGTVVDSDYTDDGVKLIPLASAKASLTYGNETHYYSTFDNVFNAFMQAAGQDDTAILAILDGSDYSDSADYFAQFGYIYDATANTLVKAMAKVLVGSTWNVYDSLAGAVAAVEDGGTVYLQRASSEAITLTDKAITLSETANFSGTLTGNGTLTFAAFRNNPSITFDNWTGTVVLPEFAANGTILNKYGVAGSKVVLKGITGGWFGETSSQKMDVNPVLQLDGNVTIKGFSTSWDYTFAELAGTGNFVLDPTDNSPKSATITKVAEDFSGIITNNTTVTLTIGTLERADGTSTAVDEKLLDVSGDVVAEALTVDGEPVDVRLETREDGIYVGAPYVAEVVDGGSYTTLQDAVDQGDVTVKILGDVTLTDKLVVDGGQTVVLTADSAVTVTGQLRVVDGSSCTIGENVTFTSASNPTVFVLGDPAVKTAGTAKSTLVVNGTVLNTNADFDQTFAIAGNGLDTQGVDVTINGTVRNANGIAIYQAFPGDLVVNGTVEGASAISIKDGTLTVNSDAVVSATLASGAAYVGNNNGDSPTGDAIIAPYYPLSKGYGTPVVSILGGTITVTDTANCTGIEAYDFDGTTAPQDAATNVNVSGGLFNTPVAEVYCASGYIPCEVTGGYSVKVQTIDPTDPTSTQEVTVDTETYTTEEDQKTAAIAAATVAIPAGVSGVDAATYKTYFTYSATPTATAGTYAVAITGFADEVTETADGNALSALEAATAGTALGTITVKPGLYYGTAAGADVTTLKAPAGELNTTGKLSLSGVTKPSTGEAFFIKIKVGATAFAAEE